MVGAICSNQKGHMVGFRVVIDEAQRHARVVQGTDFRPGDGVTLAQRLG